MDTFAFENVKKDLYPLFPVPTATSGAQGCVHFAQLLLKPSPREYSHLGLELIGQNQTTQACFFKPFCSPQNLK